MELSKWNKHVNRITAKGNRSLGFIKRNLHRCTQDIKSLTYRSLVRPSLKYCVGVWDPHTNDLIQCKEEQPGLSIMITTGRAVLQPCMMKELDWSTLAQKKDRQTGCFPQSTCNEGHRSIPVQNLLHPVTHPTRRTHNKSYIEIRANKDTFKYSFLPRTLSDWTSLPSTLVNIEEPKEFKALQQFPIRRSFMRTPHPAHLSSPGVLSCTHPNPDPDDMSTSKHF